MQEWIVGLIVVCAFLAVAKRYMPKAMRRAVRAWAVRGATRLGWNALAARLAVSGQGAASCSDGCGSCGGCGSTESPATSDERPVIKLKTMK